MERVGRWSRVMEEARRREYRCRDWDPCSCPRLWSWDVLLRKGRWGCFSARVWFETSPLVYVCRREGVQGLWVASLRRTQQPRLYRPGETTRWVWLQGLAWSHALRSPTVYFLAVDMLMRPNGKGQLSWEQPTPKDLGHELLRCNKA